MKVKKTKGRTLLRAETEGQENVAAARHVATLCAKNIQNSTKKNPSHLLRAGVKRMRASTGRRR